MSAIIGSLIIKLFLLISSISFIIDGLHLTGVTLVPNHPRSEVYQSFFHELIAEIGDVGKFDYRLQTLPEAIYGGDVGETRPQGLIGEIYDNRADFIVADLEITKERSNLVQFTRPFMTTKLAALVRRSNQTRDLYNVLQRSSKRAVIKGSLVERYFRTSKNPLVYHLLPSSIPNLAIGVNLVKTERDFALVSDSARLDLIAAADCDLEVITTKSDDPKEFGNDFHSEYAIAVAHNSPFFGYFEISLQFLDETGRLEALIDQHWFDQCKEDRIESEHLKEFKKDDNDDAQVDSGLNLQTNLLILILAFFIGNLLF